MSAQAKPLNPYLVTLVIIALLGFTLAAVFAGVAGRLVDDPLSAALYGNAAGWMLALGGASTLATLVAAAVRWQPRTVAEESTWSISYPERAE